MGTGEGLTGRVVRPGDPGYDEARLDYNLRFDKVFPSAIVFCDTADDVARTIAYARRRHRPVRVRSGRHSYEAYSIVDGGIVIDVSPMRRVWVDLRRGVARIGAGIDLGTVYQRLWDAGHVTVPGGTCGGVGLAGLALGGGFGLIGRRYGLTCDAVVGLEMVDAEGARLHVDERSHASLLWASRGGGGGNFGVVTEFTMRVQRVETVSIFRILWPWDAIADVIDGYQAWANPQVLDDRLTPVLNLKARTGGSVAAFGQFLGPAARLYDLIRPLVAVAHPYEVEIQTMPYIDAVRHFGGTAPGGSRFAMSRAEPGERFKNTSAYQYRLFDTQAIATIKDHLADTPSAACLIGLDTVGGAVARRSDTATAFAHRRGVRASLQPQAYWDTDSEQAAHVAWVDDLTRALGPFTHGGYVNYIDRALRDWPQAYYGPNLDRLLAVKRAYDPCNVFDFPQGLGQLVRAREA